SFVLSAAIVTPCSVSGMMRLQAPPCERIDRSTPGALAPVRVVLSRSILAYPTPFAPLVGTSRLHRLAAYTRCLRCAYSHRPRRPTTGSQLSSMLFHNMPCSVTPGSFFGCLYPVLHRKRWPSTPVNSFGIPVILTLRFW